MEPGKVIRVYQDADASDPKHTPVCACYFASSSTGGVKTIHFCPVHAAAPDLLAACQAALADLEGAVERWPQSMSAAKQTVERLQPAIAKARGELTFAFVPHFGAGSELA